MEDGTKTIGESIRDFRKERHLTQTELAERIGKSRKTIQNYESGLVSIPFNALCRIVDVLNISFVELMENTPGRQAVISELRQEGLTDEEIAMELELPIPEKDEDNGYDHGVSDYVTATENRIHAALHILNTEGKAKVAAYAEDLTRIPDYLNKEE